MYLILYDITEDSIRNKVSKLLEQEGCERLQFSVFVTHFNPKENKLWFKLNELLNSTPNNKIFCLKISSNSFRRMKIIGDLQLDFDYLTGEKRSLIL